jgi:hypothetical protein
MWRWAVVGLAALAGAPPAAASNAAAFTDPPGDARRGPDVTAVDVANADTGALTFRLAMPREPAALGTVVRILLDTDRNVTTGEAGADWALVVADGRTIAVQEWWIAGWVRRAQRTAPSVVWAHGPAVTIDRAELGWTNGFAFRIEATRSIGGTPHTDHAPDATAWSYDVVVVDTDGDRYPDSADNCPLHENRQFDSDRDGLGNECDDTPHPLDADPPVVEALPSVRTRAGVAYLRYRLREDGRATSERIRVIVDGRTRTVLRTPMAQIDDGVVYTTLWRVPLRAGTLTFCVSALDEAANVAPESCAPISASVPAAQSARAPSGTLVLDGEPTFVLGLSNGPPALGSQTPSGGHTLREVVRGGINMVRVGPSGTAWTDADIGRVEEWSAAAASAGARLWLMLHDLALATPGSPEADLLRRVVQRLRGHDGLGLWRGVDEPYWTRWSADALAYAYDAVRALDPLHPMLTVQAPRGTRWDFAPYAAVTSAQGVNSYPVAYVARDPDLHAVGRWTATVRAATPSNAVVTTLGVCYSGSDDPQGSGAFVQPTLRQMRYMAYDAIVNGARGLMFFGSRNPNCLTPADEPHEWNWTYWRDVLRPLLAELGPATRLHRALLAPRARLRLRVSDASTQLDVRSVGQRELWVLAARHDRGTAHVKISGLPAWATKAQVHGERRSVRTRKGVLEDRFARWDVHVYRFTR